MRRCSVVTTGHLRRDHIAAVEGVHGDVTVDRRCTDLVELIAVARAGRADAALIIGDTEGLTDSRLTELRRDDVVVVAISDLADERRRLTGLGVVALPDDVSVDLLIPALRGETVDPPQELDAELEALIAAERPQSPEGAEGSDSPEPPQSTRSPEGPAAEEEPTDSPSSTPVDAADGPEPSAGGERAASPAPEAPSEAWTSVADSTDAAGSGTGAGAEVPPSTGAGPAVDASDVAVSGAEETESEENAAPAVGITVVWGGPGSPGRTTTAVNMAAELAGTGRQVLLVDADTVAASAAVQLGLIEESAGLAQACRQADLGRLDTSRLRRIVTAVDVAGRRMHVLTGLPRADRWRELRERGLRQVLRMARDEYDHVVVDVSASIEQDEELTYDTFAPQRHAAAVAALEEADTVLAVGAADPVGFPRLVKALEERRMLVPDAPEPQVVINQLRAQAVGRSPGDQIAEAWAHWGAAATIIRHLPWDREACDAALLRGQVLAEAAPASELRRGIAALAGVSLPERRRGLFGRRRGGERRTRRRAARRGRPEDRADSVSDSAAGDAVDSAVDGPATSSGDRAAGDIAHGVSAGSGDARDAAADGSGDGAGRTGTHGATAASDASVASGEAAGSGGSVGQAPAAAASEAPGDATDLEEGPSEESR